MIPFARIIAAQAQERQSVCVDSGTIQGHRRLKAMFYALDSDRTLGAIFAQITPVFYSAKADFISRKRQLTGNPKKRELPPSGPLFQPAAYAK